MKFTIKIILIFFKSLNAILEMVNRTRQMVNHLQLKTNRLRNQVDNYENQLKRKNDSEMYEERADEIKKKVENSINEVKRQAHIEMQRAVINAENKASEILKKERERHEKNLEEIKRRYLKENSLLKQEDNILEVIFKRKKVFFKFIVKDLINLFFFNLSRTAGIVVEKLPKRVLAVKRQSIVVSFVNISIGKFCTINYVRQ